MAVASSRESTSYVLLALRGEGLSRTDTSDDGKRIPTRYREYFAFAHENEDTMVSGAEDFLKAIYAVVERRTGPVCSYSRNFGLEQDSSSS